TGVGAAHQVHGHYDQILFAGVGDFQSLLQMAQGVVIAHEHNRVSRPDGDRLGRDTFTGVEAKLVHRRGGMNLFGAPAFGSSFGDQEESEEYDRKEDAANGGDIF